MFNLEGIFFLCILLWKSGFGAHEMCPSFFPLINKPLASEHIFSIQIATASQCRYICIQNEECLAVLYASSGLLCDGYKSASEEKSLTEDEKAWKVVRRGSVTFIYCTLPISTNPNTGVCYITTNARTKFPINYPLHHCLHFSRYVLVG